ncbi:MAG: VCBS repeat-containing protein [Fluviicola sp.]|nr:VCBS repeat-containing protein [Fluviicola sp.]
MANNTYNGSIPSNDDQNRELSSVIEMPQVISPSGGGAIKGIDEQFKVNSANGTAGFSIPLPLSPGRNGFTPSLSLSYNSGGGNGSFGLGWQLGVGSISIKTDKSLPKYSTEDSYQFTGSEELVPYLKETTSNNWEEVKSAVDGYTVQRYRPRTEGAFSKIEKISHSDHGVYWKVTSRDNTVTIFGRSSTARIADPEDETRIFQWLAELSYDDKGNWIKYIYKEEDLENVSNELHEKHRLNEISKITNQYLKRVQYGNKQAYYSEFESYFDPTDPTEIESSEEAEYFFELVFDYGEHDDDQPQLAEETEWEQRADAFSSFRSGFEIRTNRLCKRVLLFHQFEELGEDPCLVKSLELNYTPSNINNSGQSETTYLTSAIQSGYIKKEDGSYSVKSFPAMNFDYQTLEWNNSIQHIEEENIANTPVGLSNNYLWTDLYGEGISGILTEQQGGWYYKQNLGNLNNEGAQFTAVHQVAKTPSIKGLNNGAIALQDLNANGEKQLVVNTPEVKGFYAMDTEEPDQLNLDPFISFKNTPNVNWQDPNTRFIDLNGDGKPELVVTEENALVWYENLGKEGYKEGVKAFKSFDEDEGPAVVFSDASQSIYLADLCGDGLTDIVRIRNGEICYWPNKGYGNFGAKIAMSNAPLFDYPDQYDPKYLHLADVSGTGATDIIYLGGNEFKAYINHSGNSWSDAHDIDPFVPVDNYGKLSVIDLLGTGTSCIVWSSDLPGQAPMRYIDLMSSKKPHVMTGYTNNMGKEVAFSYKSSTYFYLKDKREGNPWITKLPFPVQVVATTTTTDYISSSQLSTSYQYHHGYYDHAEREFRGFGMVEQTDQESFETYQEGDELDMAPVLTKTWIHTGSYTEQSKLSKQYQQEYYKDDAITYEFPDSTIEKASSMSYKELQEANRALRGTTLRQELYTLDGSDKEFIPYTISETNFTIKQIQPQEANQHGVYQSLGRESLSYSCERNTADPRIGHQMVLEEDEYGHPTKTVQISYPRRSAITDAYEEQQQLAVIVQTAAYENEEDDYYRLGLLTEQKQYEIQGLSLGTDTFFTLDDLNTQLNDANTFETSNVLKHNESFGSGVQAKLLAWSNNYYKGGDLKALALPNYKESIIMSSDWVTTAYDGKVDAAKMLEARYEEKDGHWWIVSEKPSYQDADGFYLPYQTEDVYGNVSSVSYDDYNLSPTGATDALDNIVEAEIDYRTLGIYKTTDINGSISEAVTDELGMVIATTVYGTEEGVGKGDSPIIDYEKVGTPTLADVVNNPLDYLQEATSFFYYHIESWEAGNLPPHFVQLQRETHVSELLEGEETAVQISLGYSDGFGRELQSKVYMGDEQWIVSGRTVYNNKEKPVKQYEPFIADTYLYQTEEEVGPVGVTPIMYYDALGRLTRTETPDGFFSKVEFTPWQVSSYDPNDTVKDSRNYAENLALIGTTDPKGIALEKAEAHYNTPTTVVLDSLGREFMAMQLKEEGDPFITYTEFDIQGNPLTLTDPRQYTANQSRIEADQINNFTYIYDLAGNVLKTVSQDAGTSYNLINVMGNPLYVWNARDYRTTMSYDVLHRPTEMWIEGDGMDHLVQKMEYGTDASKNQNGQLLTTYDQAGKTENTSFSFKGQILSSTRQLCSDYKSDPNWEDPSIVSMEAANYTSSMEYNALGRITKNIHPDGSVHTLAYYHIGWLKSVQVKLRESTFGTTSTSSATTFVENIDYDAKGQRTKITYGNGVSTTYTYDEQTFLLTGLITKREEDSGIPTTLQDISYGYDPIGNILKITDNSHDKVFTAGQAVDADMEYVYDALYQLKEATGREHLALSKTDYQRDNETFKNAHFANINDANQLRNYTRKYTYDDGGNLTQLKHIGENSFTREISVADNSNKAFIQEDLNASVDVDSYFDVAGNMTHFEHLAGISWNYRNNIASAIIIERDSENDAEYYVYDGSGQRIRKVKETYNSDGDLLWTEEKTYLGGVEIKRKYQGNTKTLIENRSTIHIMDGSRRIALVYYWDESNDSSVTTGSNKTHYQLSNHLGSTSMELNVNGQLISYEEYFPFGGTAFTTGSSAMEVKLKEYRYTGKERDDATGLYYYGARYYAPWMGRWLNPDPAGTVDGLNLFRFVRNNPIKLIDPNGESPTLVSGGVGLVVGGLIGGGIGLWSEWDNPEGISWGKVAAHGAGGAVSGGLAGLTGGASLTVTSSTAGGVGLFLAGEGIAGVAGGTVTRSLLGEETTSEDVATDLLISIVTAGVMKGGGTVLSRAGQRMSVGDEVGEVFVDSMEELVEIGSRELDIPRPTSFAFIDDVVVESNEAISATQRVFYGADGGSLLTQSDFDELLAIEDSLPALAKKIHATDTFQGHVFAVGVIDGGTDGFMVGVAQSTGNVGRKLVPLVQDAGAFPYSFSGYMDDIQLTTKSGNLTPYRHAEVNLLGNVRGNGNKLLSVYSYPLIPCTMCSPMLMAEGVTILNQ